MHDKFQAERENLQDAVREAVGARSAFEGDFILQLMSFRQKGVLQQSAFVMAILVANQAVYQALLIAKGSGGSLEVAVGGIMLAVGLVWYYGYRPFSF